MCVEKYLATKTSTDVYRDVIDAYKNVEYKIVLIIVAKKQIIHKVRIIYAKMIILVKSHVLIPFAKGCALMI